MRDISSPERPRRRQPSQATYCRRRALVAAGLIATPIVVPAVVSSAWDLLTRMPTSEASAQGNPAGAALDAAIQEQIQRGYSPADGDRLLGFSTLGERDVSTINGAMAVDARQAGIDFRPNNDNTDGKAAHWSLIHANMANPNPQPNEEVITWVDCSTKIGECTVLAALADSSSDSPTSTSVPLPPGEIEKLLGPKQQQLL